MPAASAADSSLGDVSRDRPVHFQGFYLVTNILALPRSSSPVPRHLASPPLIQAARFGGRKLMWEEEAEEWRLVHLH